MSELLRPIPRHVTSASWIATPPTDTEPAYLLDPGTGRRLDVAMPHSWLRADKRLARGYTRLEKLGGTLAVDVLLIRHREAADLGDPDTYERRVATHDMCALEHVGWNQAKVARLFARLRAYKPIRFQ